MQSFLERALLATVVAVGFASANAGSAQAADGCVGLPNYGGLFYHCMAANTALPKVNTTGTTYVGTTIPSFCYFLGCTGNIPVGYAVPVNITTSNPSSDVTVFQLRYSCYESYYYGTYCANTYEIIYDAPGSFCEFRTDDPTLSVIDGQRVRCTV